MLKVFGFMRESTQDKSAVRTALKYYVRIFNIYYIFGSIVPLFLEKDFRMFAERVNVTAFFYYGVIVSFVFLYNSDAMDEFSQQMTNSRYSVEISPLRKFRVFVIPYMMIIMIALSNVTEAIVKGTGTVSGIWLPFDLHSSGTVYYSTSFLMMLSVLPAVNCIGVANGFLSVAMISFADLFRTLQKRIANISKIEGEVAESDRDKLIRIRFHECIVMHNWILRQFKTSKGVFQTIVTMRCAIISLAYISCGAVILLELSEQNLAGLSSTVSFLLATSCFSSLYFTISDEMKYESLQLSRSWYDADWPSWPRDVRRALPFALARAQLPVVYRAFGHYDFTQELFLQILSNCYTSFAFIREIIFN